MKEKSSILGILLLTCLLVSNCTKEVIIDFDEMPPQLAVFLFLSNDLVNHPAATIHTTTTVLDNETLTGYSDATVLLYENGELRSHYLHNVNGFYYPDSMLSYQPGVEYELEVLTEDFGTLSAKEIMPDFPKILGATHTPIGLTDIHMQPYDDFLLSFEKKSTERKYYQASVYAQKRWNPSEEYQMWTWSNEPNIMSGPNGRGIIFSDEQWEVGQVDVDLRFSIVYFNPEDDRLLIELSEITEDLFFYLKGLNNQINTANNPFAEPVIIPSNIEGGLGLFSLQAASHFVLPD